MRKRPPDTPAWENSREMHYVRYMLRRFPKMRTGWLGMRHRRYYWGAVIALGVKNADSHQLYEQMVRKHQHSVRAKYTAMWAARRRKYAPLRWPKETPEQREATAALIESWYRK